MFCITLVVTRPFVDGNDFSTKMFSMFNSFQLGQEYFPSFCFLCQLHVKNVSCCVKSTDTFSSFHEFFRGTFGFQLINLNLLDRLLSWKKCKNCERYETMFPRWKLDYLWFNFHFVQKLKSIETVCRGITNHKEKTDCFLCVCIYFHVALALSV